MSFIAFENIMVLDAIAIASQPRIGILWLGFCSYAMQTRTRSKMRSGPFDNWRIPRSF